MTLLKVVGINQVMEKMAKRRASLIDRKKVNGWAIIAIDQWIQKNFEGEGKLAVGGWQPLAPATIARRRGAGSVKILQDTGALKGRWKHFYDKRRGWIRSGVPYAAAHHFGGRLPKRPLIPTRDQIMPTLIKIYGQFVKVSVK